MYFLYKYSQFNIEVSETIDYMLLYNTYSLKYRWISKPEYADIKDNLTIDIGDVPVELAESGFIVPVDIDEIQRLKDEAYSKVNHPENMFISIFTTLACNYRCVYCFEKDQLCNSDHMTIETADETIAFIKRYREKYNVNNPVHIKWFGGEPLLNMEIIRYITTELRNNNIKLWAKMYTNGRLLTRDLALELKELGVTDDVVIPIDGLAENYARIKGCSEKDFYTVLENIRDTQDILRIVIHLNVSDSTKQDTTELYRVIREDYGIKCRVLVNSIQPMNTDSVNEDNDISTESLYELKELINKQSGIQRTLSGCEGRQFGYIVIDPKGYTYICEHLVGQDDYKLKHISECNGYIDRIGTIWDNNRVIDECGDCPILPTCLGQCSTNKFIEKIDCNKDVKIQNIKDIVRRLSEQNGNTI